MTQKAASANGTATDRWSVFYSSEGFSDLKIAPTRGQPWPLVCLFSNLFEELLEAVFANVFRDISFSEFPENCFIIIILKFFGQGCGGLAIYVRVWKVATGVNGFGENSA